MLAQLCSTCSRRRRGQDAGIVKLSDRGVPGGKGEKEKRARCAMASFAVARPAVSSEGPGLSYWAAASSRSLSRPRSAASAASRGTKNTTSGSTAAAAASAARRETGRQATGRQGDAMMSPVSLFPCPRMFMNRRTRDTAPGTAPRCLLRRQGGWNERC